MLSPSDAADQEAVVGSRQCVVVISARGPGDAPIQHCLEYFSFQHLDLELKGSTRSHIQFEGGFPEGAPGITCEPVDLCEQVGVAVDASPEVYEIVRLFMQLTGCFEAVCGRGIRYPLRPQTHDLSLGLRNSDHDYGITF